jgi:secondary thiamine-phosphate synthase enzyme
MVIYKELTIYTKEYNEMILITDKVLKEVEKSPVKSGIVVVISKHTTTGITVNESLECLESDIDNFLKNIIPEDYPYSHARMLKDYGSTAGNPTGHLKSHITGNNCTFSIVDGKVIRGSAQDIYFCEFDGPAERTFSINIIGE